MSILSQVQLEHPFIISRLKMSDSASAQVAVDDVGGLSFPVIGSPERQLPSIVSGDTSPCSCGLGSANYWEAVLQPWILTNGLAVEAVCVRDPYGGNLTLFAAPGQFELKALNEQLSWTVKTAANHTLTAAAQLHGWPQHVVCNYDIAAGLQSIYVDGALVASQALAGAISTALSGNVVLMKGERIVFNKLNNPSFEYDTNGAAPAWWHENSFGTITKKTFAVQESQAISGKKSLRYAIEKVAHNGGGGIETSPGTAVSAIPGVTYTLAGRYTINTLPANVRVFAKAEWRKADGVTKVGTEISVSSTNGTLVGSGVAPAEAAFVYIQFFVFNENAGEVALIDIAFDALIFAPSSSSAYIDGDLRGYEWEGTHGNSSTVASTQATAQDIAIYGAPLSARQIKRHFEAFRQILPDPGHVRQFSPIGVTT